MGKVNAPLLSLGAKGSLADTLTFQKRGTGTIVRKKPEPKQPDSDPQLWHRYLYRQACQYWQTLTATQKKQWETDARRKRMPGFAYFMRTELNRLINLMLCLPLDENGGSAAIDFSGSRNHGTIFGALWRPGVINSCLLFDGIDDRLVIPHDVTISTLDAISLEAWIYPTGWGSYPVSGWGRIFDKQTTAYMLYLHAPQNFIALRIGGATKVSDNNSIILNAWQHIVATYDRQNVRFFVDKVPVGVRALTGPISTNNNDLIIGNSEQYAWARTFDGYIDEPREYNAVLSQTEINMHCDRRG